MTETAVLIVGAGPTGLALAHRLVRHGVPFRIIDRNTCPGTASRAMGVHARTLELYQQLGLADEMVARGIRMDAVTFHTNDHTARINFGDLGAGLSPYPFVLSLPQDEHERLLVERLAELGVQVEWETELVSFAEDARGVRIVLEKWQKTEELRVAYLCGCDGAHSMVRQQLWLDFPGGTYDEMFYVADVRADRELSHEFIGTLGDRALALMFPIRRTGMQRLIGIVPRELRNRKDLQFADVQPFAEQLLGINVAAVNWFSAYHVHHRVAGHFRVGRVFIAGDAAHIHSPAGAQGMNTGIGDAVNLAWKIAQVQQGRIDPSVLDTYESERIPFAKSLVRTTDRAFQLFVGGGWSARFIRTVFIPHILPLLTSITRTRRRIFKLVSQTRIDYEKSALSEGRAGNVHGGDRLPWVSHDRADNFKPLESLDWQVHVYGSAQPELRAGTSELDIPLHVFDWSRTAEKAGLARDAIYLVRPDGYVALASTKQDPALLRRYQQKWRLSPPSQPLTA